MVAPAAWNCNYTWFEWARLVFLIALDMIAGSTLVLFHLVSSLVLIMGILRDPYNIVHYLLAYPIDALLPLILLVMLLAAINYLIAPPPALAWFLAKLDALDKKAAAA
jgi:hypothetical protein